MRAWMHSEKWKLLLYDGITSTIRGLAKCMESMHMLMVNYCRALFSKNTACGNGETCKLFRDVNEAFDESEYSV